MSETGPEMEIISLIPCSTAVTSSHLFSWEVTDNPRSSLGDETSRKQRSQRVHLFLYSRKGSGWGKGMKGWNTRLGPSWLQDKRFALKKTPVISYFLNEKWCPRCGASSSQRQSSVSPIIFIMGLDWNLNPTGLPWAWGFAKEPGQDVENSF